jgi:acyl transferase domain-containing protein
MSDFFDKISQYSPKRLALLADDLQNRLQALEAKASEPIAIVGIGCRLPGGADTPDKLWDLLQAGTDAVVEVPADRWSLDDLYNSDPDAPGKISTRWGGFLNEVDRFDPHFFGISPREAHSMDPQQRLLLEVAWEALEHAGISAQRVEGSRTGVFLGVSASDYYQVLRADGVEGFDAYTASGVAHSIASGRLSYVLGARGPSISIDTACSSSLVAIHLAVQSLRRDECAMALAGGVNLILGPDITIALSRARMMAPDGRCKAFDAKADGFVRGEGCGMLVLKRLSRAQADGDRIIALIRGSASNQDGRSNGLTAPNGPSQEDVIRDALANARVAPAEVSVVEAHGTGTSLGDPIEIQALDQVASPL